MKIVKKIVIHPHIGNDIRSEVYNWCDKQFPDTGTSEFITNDRWVMTSNYDRSKDGTFDVIFYNEKDAHWFLLKWGGEIVEIEADEIYGVSNEMFDSLFEYETKI